MMEYYRDQENNESDPGFTSIHSFQFYISSEHQIEFNLKLFHLPDGRQFDLQLPQSQL